MSRVKLHDLEFEPFLSEAEVGAAVDRLAADLKAKYADKRPLFVGVLNGAFFFAAELMKRLDIECEITFVKVASYLGTSTTGRVTDLIGKARMVDMMLTGRVYQGQEAVDLGLAQYLVEDTFAHALALARRCAENLPLTNFAICSGVSHMQNMSALDAAYAEACVAGIVNTQPEARARLAAFADKSGARIRPKA